MFQYYEMLELARQHQADLRADAAVRRLLRRQCGIKHPRLPGRLNYLGCVLRSVLV